MFFYEGRTIRGLGLVGWALLVQLGAVLAAGAALAALALLLAPALLDPAGALGPLVGVVAGICGVELAEVAMAILFLVGFHHLAAGRHEYGLEHVRSVGRAIVCVVVFGVLTVITSAYLLAVDFFEPTTQAVLGQSLLTGQVVLSPVGAALAGLGLWYAARSVSGPEERRRLRSALALGIAGGAAGPGLISFATLVNPLDVRAVSSGLLAAAVAGYGMSAISLLLFVLAFRDIRRDLVAGRPPPALPRVEQVYPWLWTPWSGRPPPAPWMPPQPPKE